jgi:hypothetical protein
VHEQSIRFECAAFALNYKRPIIEEHHAAIGGLDVSRFSVQPHQPNVVWPAFCPLWQATDVGLDQENAVAGKDTRVAALAAILTREVADFRVCDPPHCPSRGNCHWAEQHLGSAQFVGRQVKWNYSHQAA